jgi:hypothetical protein
MSSKSNSPRRFIPRSFDKKWNKPRTPPVFNIRRRYANTHQTGSHTMPRRARLSVAGVPRHIIQRGNNRTVCFHANGDSKLDVVINPRTGVGHLDYWKLVSPMLFFNHSASNWIEAIEKPQVPVDRRYN